MWNEIGQIFILAKHSALSLPQKLLYTLLVESSGREINSESLGKPFEEAYPYIYTIEVVHWEILEPILRNYTYRTKEQKARLFTPSKYIDQFDVDNGDYQLQAHLNMS